MDLIYRDIGLIIRTLQVKMDCANLIQVFEEHEWDWYLVGLNVDR